MKIIRYIPAAIVFIAIACYFLLGCYSDMLFTAQDRSVFVASSLFFCDCMSRPFGLMQYLGSYLTQFFYVPALGASMLIAIWVASYGAAVKAFGLTSRWAPLFLLPLACLLASIVDVGYWIYCFTLPGYWFSQSLAYLIMLLMLWGFRSTPDKWQSCWYVVAALMFPLIGWTAILMAICMFVMQIMRWAIERRKGIVNRDNIICFIGLQIVLAAPKLLWQNIIYKHLNDNVIVNAGFPWFENSTSSSEHPVLPFYILIAATLLFAVFAYTKINWDKYKVITKLHINYIPVTVIMAAVAFYGVSEQMFDDYNYQAEMRMTQATMNSDWQGVIDEEMSASAPSRTMVMLKNIALMNMGNLGEKSFEIDNNSGIEIYNPDSLNLNIMLMVSPMVYYNFGYHNYAIRWGVENAVVYGFSPFYLKMLALSAAATGEKELEARYTKRLNMTQFYADWKAHKPSELVNALSSTMNNNLAQDFNNCELYLIEELAKTRGTKNPVLQDMSLFYALLMRDASKFWPAFTEYVATHQGKPLPVSYQEAYVMFMDIKPVELSFKVDIEPTILQNYRSFWKEGQEYADRGFTKEGVADMMLSNWRSSYWWFNAFGRDKY